MITIDLYGSSLSFNNFYNHLIENHNFIYQKKKKNEEIDEENYFNNKNLTGIILDNKKLVGINILTIMTNFKI